MNNGDLTLEELCAAANEMARRHWGVDYTGTIELVNRKWSRLNGRFEYSKKDRSKQRIVLSRKRNAERTREEVLGTLLHELVHWRLWSQDIPAKDTADTFIAECLRVGAPISLATEAQKAYAEYMARMEAAV